MLAEPLSLLQQFSRAPKDPCARTGAILCRIRWDSGRGCQKSQKGLCSYTLFIQALWTKTIHALDPGFFWTRVYLKQILGGALLADVPCLGG